MSKIQFIHRRPSTSPTGFTGPASRGGFTVAYREVDGGTVEYCVAQCSTRDNFNKKLGREIAAGRLTNSNLQFVMQADLKEFRNYMYSMPV